MGKLFDEAGVPLTPSHAVKSGRRYRYYVSRHLVAGTGDRPENRGWRLPAREIERTVATAVGDLLADRGGLTRVARNAGMAADRIPRLLDATAGWKPDGLRLVERVDLGPDRIALTLRLAPLTGEPGPTIRHAIPTRIRRRGVVSSVTPSLV